MTREEFAAMTANLVQDGTISEEERQALLAAWDAGEITAQDLPLAPREGSTSLPEALMLAALLDALLRGVRGLEQEQQLARLAARLRLEVAQREATGRLLEEYQRRQAQRLLEAHGGGRELPPATGETREEARGAGNRILEGLPFSRKRKLARDFVDMFSQEAESRVDRYLFGDYDDGMRRFHIAMREASRDDLMALAAIGKGRPLDAADLNRLGVAWRKQQAHLQRFTEEIAARREAGDPMTRKQIKARARMYQGMGYSAFWRFASEERGQGWVVEWVARDDPITCSGCRHWEDISPFPAGSPHPLPGSPACFGLGNCRCELRFEFDPQKYSEIEDMFNGEAALRPYFGRMRDDPLTNVPTGGTYNAGDYAEWLKSQV